MKTGLLYKMNNLPKYLYHYTSIENLSLILRNRTLRFTRLDKVNDPDEVATKNFPDAKYFIYASCWTSQEKETIPMWKMYSNDMKGVRLRLPINMFKGRCNPEYDSTGHPIMAVAQNINIGNFVSQGTLVGPAEVTYPIDPENTEICFNHIDDEAIEVKLLHLGLTKRDYWAYENEWRYRIFALPVEGHWKKRDYDLYMQGEIPEYLNLQLDETTFSELIIQLGPRATFAEDLIVQALCKEYAPSGPKLYDSSIKIRQGPSN